MNLFVSLLVGAWTLSPIVAGFMMDRAMRKAEAIADVHEKEHEGAIAALRLHLKYMTEGLTISRDNERKYINAIEVLRRENADLRVANAEMKNAT
jgi:hypothetical protein